MSNGKTVKQLRAAYNRGARWCVIVHYDSARLGARGDIISTHKTYELASASAKRSGWESFVAVRELTPEACGI